ncbi:hypothetical protein WT01_01935 [Burkholderia cepacia]|nr:hypothetical protein WT01_01935 [Burkholderia cepacia]
MYLISYKKVSKKEAVVRSAGWCAPGAYMHWRAGTTYDAACAAVEAQAASSTFGMAGSETGFPDDDHSFIRYLAWRFGRMAGVDGACRGACAMRGK